MVVRRMSGEEMVTVPASSHDTVADLLQSIVSGGGPKAPGRLVFGVESLQGKSDQLLANALREADLIAESKVPLTWVSARLSFHCDNPQKDYTQTCTKVVEGSR